MSTTTSHIERHHMQSFIIVGRNDEQKKKCLHELIEKDTISQFDQVVVEPEGKSIGIEDIRNLQKNILLKPVEGTTKAIIIDKAETLTTEAQNALLKVLEEPPRHTKIFLLVSKIDALLETICSRCFVITIKETSVHKQTDITVQDVIDADLGEKLYYAQTYGGSKEEAIRFLEALTESIKKSVIDSTPRYYEKTLEKIVQTHKTISLSNIAPRFALEHLLLSIN